MGKIIKFNLFFLSGSMDFHIELTMISPYLPETFDYTKSMEVE
jgi:hypothetical protein